MIDSVIGLHASLCPRQRGFTVRALRAGQALGALGITAAAVLIPLATATPAAAYDYSSPCINYVGAHGYAVGPKVREACSHGAIHIVGWMANPVCVKGLVEIRVSNAVADGACVRAHL